MPDLHYFMNFQHSALIAATLITLVNYGLYLRAVLRGKFRPHLFSWIVWTLLPSIAFAAQWSENAGPGMYQTGIFALCSGIIMLAAVFYGERSYTRSDWLCLLFSLAAIPAWAFSHNALYAVLIVVLIDIVGMIPTIRKSWNDPYGESPGLFLFGAAVFLLGLAALKVWNPTTILYPLTLITLNTGFVVMLYCRRARATRV